MLFKQPQAGRLRQRGNNSQNTEPKSANKSKNIESSGGKKTTPKARFD